MGSKRVTFSLDELERIRAAASHRGLGQAEFVHQCVLRILNPGYVLSEEEDHRVFEAARALNTSKAEFAVRAILHACDEVEALGREQMGHGYREPLSPFRGDRCVP